MQGTPTGSRTKTGQVAVLVATGVMTAAALAVTTPFARAASVSANPLEPALGFNAFVETQTTLASTEAEGPIATGGDLVIDGAYNVSLHSTGTFTAGTDASPADGTGGTHASGGTHDSGGALSTTGTAVLPLLIAAGALLAVGGLVIIAAVRRRGDAPI